MASHDRLAQLENMSRAQSLQSLLVKPAPPPASARESPILRERSKRQNLRNSRRTASSAFAAVLFAGLKKIWLGRGGKKDMARCNQRAAYQLKRRSERYREIGNLTPASHSTFSATSLLLNLNLVNSCNGILPSTDISSEDIPPPDELIS